MKKLISMLSALTITSAIVPTIVACDNKENKNDEKINVTDNNNNANHNNNNNNNNGGNNKETKGLDLNSINSSMFKRLDIIPIGIGPITTRNINDINSEVELEYAIRSHIRVMLLKNVFGLDNLSPNTLDGIQALSLFTVFVGTTPSVLDIQIKAIKSMKEYRVTITKEKWENLKGNTLLSSQLKRYYNLIKGEKVVLTITRGKKEIVNEKEFNINNLNADMFKELKIIDWDTFLINTKNIKEINNNKEIVNGIESTIWVMILNKIFGFEGSSLKVNPKKIPLLKFVVMYRSVTTPIIKVNSEQIEPNKKYILTIEKEKWGNIKLNDETIEQLGEENKITLADIKPYYDLIKGETTVFDITK